MKVVKILGKKYIENEIEENSKIIRRWFVLVQINKVKIEEKYHVIDNVDKVNAEFAVAMTKLDEETRDFYEKYLAEPWRETFPIMKDVSRFEKIRPVDGIEFCLLI